MMSRNQYRLLRAQMAKAGWEIVYTVMAGADSVSLYIHKETQEEFLWKPSMGISEIEKLIHKK